MLFIFSLGDTLAGDGFDFAGRCVRLVLGQARGAVQKRGFKMFGQTFSGIEITVREANGSIVCAPTYEAHTTAKQLELINATQAMLTAGRSITWRLF